MNGNVISVGKHRHKKCGKDVISVNIVAIVLVGFFALLCLIPFYLIIVASFTDETYLIRNGYPIFPQLQSFINCSVSVMFEKSSNNCASIWCYNCYYSHRNVSVSIFVNNDRLCSFKTGFSMERKSFILFLLYDFV